MAMAKAMMAMAKTSDASFMVVLFLCLTAMKQMCNEVKPSAE
jgi:hypothetical protein